MELKDLIKSAAVMSPAPAARRTNAPPQYAMRKRQYMADETARSTQQNSRYSSDYFDSDVQGLDQKDFYAWKLQSIRMADIAIPTATGAKVIDDIKQILFANPAVSYVPRGAKVRTMGSTWLVTNPQNISTVSANAVVERCNAVWNHLDYFGNIMSEPISISKPLMAASGGDKQQFVVNTDGYFNIKAQINPATADLKQNSRIILGSGAYAIRGVTDFLREFTDDPSSVHLVEFTGQYTEPNAEDDIENGVAGGLAFSWSISISGQAGMGVGQTAQFAATSIRNGEPPTMPHSYRWETSNSAIAVVDSAGLVTALAEGTATITATLAENPSKSAQFAVRVEGTVERLAFVTAPPNVISQYDEATVEAAHYQNGTVTGEIVTWSFTGAKQTAYRATVDGNRAKIECFGASAVPLKVTAICKELSVSTEVRLTGL